MRYFVVDAFAQVPFGGNPAGVVLLEGDCKFPADELMIKIAAELRYSETAFVQQNGPAEFAVRYFTPAAEVDLCGHATIAAFSVLRDEGIVPEGTVCMNHTLAGDLEVIVGKQIMMQMAAPKILETKIDEQQLRGIMGNQVAQGDICGSGNAGDGQICLSGRKIFPSEVVSTGLPDIIMHVGSVEQLHNLRPDMAALSDLSARMEVVGVHAFAFADDGYTAHVRNFAPLYDIPEESATGTANAALTYYLLRHGVVAAGAVCSFMQGEKMRRPSVVVTQIHESGSIYVGGNSYILARGEMSPEQASAK